MSIADRVSVIVPYLNGAAHLPDLCDSLVGQDFDSPWEVVAVDNGSTDGSQDVVRRYQGRLDLTLVNAFERRTASFARNVGVQRASGGRLIFIDADDAVDPHYVSAMSAALANWPLVTSRVDSAALNPEWVRDVHGPPWQETGIGVFFGFLPAAGSNIGVQRQLFEQVGGFPEDFNASADLAFSWNAQLRGGARIQFVPDALYYYRYRHSYAALLRQSANWGRDTVRLYKRFRAEGMPGRTFEVTAGDWLRALKVLLPRLKRADRASAIVAGGYCLGRLDGSLRYRVSFL
jgi:glycosyltransferase involved in cell wall biosynthesis